MHHLCNKLMQLTPKQQRFVDEYLVDLNATQAAIRAGYSKKTARKIGHENLTKPDLQKYISLKQQDREKRTEITQDRVLKEYAKLAFLDPKLFFDEDGALLPVHKIPKDSCAALSGFDVNRIGDSTVITTTKIKFADKLGALNSLAKHLGMFSESSRDQQGALNVSINFTDA